MTNLPTNEDELLQIDNSTWANQKLALDRLKNKHFFKKLIEEGYFKTYTFDLVMTLIRRDIVEQGKRNVIIEKLVGIAKLQDYFDMVSSLSTTEDDYQEQLEKDFIKNADRVSALNDALDQAEQDPDFKLLIKDNYLDAYVKNQASLMTNDTIVTGGHRGEVLEAIAGVSTLINFIVDVRKEYVETQAYLQGTNDEDEEMED